ncbi:MAG: cytochrome c peroxidase [Byssovorax sp.]
MKRALAAIAAALLVAACGEQPGPAAAPPLRAPQHGPVPSLPTFPDDPVTPEKIALGRYLYFDERLSGSGHTDCAACHVPATAFQDNLNHSIPDGSYPSDAPPTARNTSSMLNLVHAPISRWDGSGTDLLEVLMRPFAETNMNLGADVPSAQIALKKRLTVTAPAYPALFQEAFAEDIAQADPARVWLLTARALRAFLTKVISRDAAFDRWNAGDDTAMSAAAQRGLALFDGKARCSGCHGGPLFTDFAFHNVSTAPPGPDGSRADEGRSLVTGDAGDRGKFLTPTLRSAYQTGPYFHDGSVFTLQQVIRHKASAAVTADPLHDAIFDAPLDLTDDEIADLVQLLGALRGADIRAEITEPAPGEP